MNNRWSAEEDFILILRRQAWRPETIARKLGRSVKAIENRSRRTGCWPTKGDLMTSGEAAKISGWSQQWCIKLAKREKFKAKRVPGGRWWLIDPGSFLNYLREINRRILL